VARWIGGESTVHVGTKRGPASAGVNTLSRRVPYRTKNVRLTPARGVTFSPLAGGSREWGELMQLGEGTEITNRPVQKANIFSHGKKLKPEASRGERGAGTHQQFEKKIYKKILLSEKIYGRRC